ncbi:phage major capsid protein [Methanobrevibacter sp.]|uniref:phage major capsid protein n=1 Tax=Methanobrevibacter sp. TaxID=66852 RepID=UPI00388DD3A9
MAFNSMKAQIEKKNDLIKKAESIINLAETEKRELTDAEAQELAEIRDDVKKIKDMLEMMGDLDDARACGGKMEKKEDAGAEAGADAKADDAQRELAERRSFDAYIRGKVLETRDAVNMTEGANGAVIPVTIAKKIIAKVYDICPILERSSKYSLKGDLEIPYYDESSTAITVAWAEEFVDLTSSVGSFTNITLKDYLAGALTLISRKLINNSEFDLVAFVIDRMALAIARFIEGACLNGGNPDATSHVNQVKGLAGSVTQTVLAGSTSAITADKVIELKDSVKDVFQNDAIFIMSRATRTALRLLKDDVGRYLLQDDIASPFGSTLLGKPVYVSDNMPEIASGVNAIYYGDMKGLATKFSEDVNIQVLREKYATSHAVGVVGWVSFDAKVENAQAISALVMSAS